MTYKKKGYYGQRDSHPEWQERRDMVVRLRSEGKTYKQIAEVLGVTQPRVGQLYFSELRRKARRNKG